MPMTPNECIDILTEHNKWRRGEPPYDTIPSIDVPSHPKDIGEAIDYAVKHLEIVAHAQAVKETLNRLLYGQSLPSLNLNRRDIREDFHRTHNKIEHGMIGGASYSVPSRFIAKLEELSGQ